MQGTKAVTRGKCGDKRESSEDVRQMACMFAVGRYLMKRGDDAEKWRRQGYERVSLGSKKGWKLASGRG